MINKTKHLRKIFEMIKEKESIQSKSSDLVEEKDSLKGDIDISGGDNYKIIEQILIERKAKNCSILDPELEANILMHCIANNKTKIALLIIEARFVANNVKLEALKLAVAMENAWVTNDLLEVIPVKDLANCGRFPRKNSKKNDPDNLYGENVTALNLNYDSRFYDIFKSITNNMIIQIFLNKFYSENTYNLLKKLSVFKCWKVISYMLEGNIIKLSKGGLNSLLLELVIRTDLTQSDEKNLFHYLLKQPGIEVSCFNNLLLMHCLKFQDKYAEVIDILFAHNSVDLKCYAGNTNDSTVKECGATSVYCNQLFPHVSAYVAKLREGVFRFNCKYSNKKGYDFLRSIVPLNPETAKKIIATISPEDYQTVIINVFEGIQDLDMFGGKERGLKARANEARWNFLHALIIENDSEVLSDIKFIKNIASNKHVWTKFCFYSKFTKDQSELFNYVFTSLALGREYNKVDKSDLKYAHLSICEYMLAIFSYRNNAEATNFLLNHPEMKIRLNMPLLYALSGGFAKNKLNLDLIEKILQHKSYDIKSSRGYQKFTGCNTGWRTKNEVKDLGQYEILDELHTAYVGKSIYYHRYNNIVGEGSYPILKIDFTFYESQERDKLRKENRQKLMDNPELIKLFLAKIPKEDYPLIMEKMIRGRAPLSFIKYFMENTSTNYGLVFDELLRYGLNCRYTAYSAFYRNQDNRLLPEEEWVLHNLVKNETAIKNINQFIVSKLLPMHTITEPSQYSSNERLPLGRVDLSRILLYIHAHKNKSPFKDMEGKLSPLLVMALLAAMPSVKRNCDNYETAEDILFKKCFKEVYKTSLRLKNLDESTHPVRDVTASSDKALTAAGESNSFGPVKYTDLGLTNIPQIIARQIAPSLRQYLSLGIILKLIYVNEHKSYMKMIMEKLSWNYQQRFRDVFNKHFAMDAANHYMVKAGKEVAGRPVHNLISYDELIRKPGKQVDSIIKLIKEAVKKNIFCPYSNASYAYLYRLAKNVSSKNPEVNFVRALISIYKKKYFTPLYYYDDDMDCYRNSLWNSNYSSPGVLALILEYLGAPPQISSHFYLYNNTEGSHTNTMTFMLLNQMSKNDDETSNTTIDDNQMEEDSNNNSNVPRSDMSNK